MTLIEVLIVLALIALIMGAVVVGSGQMESSQRRRASTMLTGAIRVGFAHASATSKTVRLVMDFEENAIWLEEGDQPHLVQSKDLTGTGGAAAATAAEKQAQEESSRIVQGPTPPKTFFKEVMPMGLAASDPGKGHKALGGNVRFGQVQCAHDAEPRRSDRAYLYFWPGSQTERCAITLHSASPPKDPTEPVPIDESRAVTLIVAPLTGKVTVHDGVVELPAPVDDKEASDREDPGAF